MDFAAYIRTFPDFPRPGIRFRDIAPLLGEPAAFAAAIDALAALVAPTRTIVAIESRGFVFGAALALRWGARFVPARKFGKLPGPTWRQSYALEYGEDALELQRGALAPGESVAIVDDLLATGGTAAAVARLVEQAGARVEAALFAIELVALDGRARLAPVAVHALVRDTAP